MKLISGYFGYKIKLYIDVFQQPLLNNKGRLFLIEFLNIY